MLKAKCLFLLLAILLLCVVKITFAEEIPRIYVDPTTIEIYIGQTFSINITITNVTDLHALDIKLRYDTNILDALQLTMLSPWPANKTSINDSEGYVWINSTLTSPSGISGNTTVAKITFKGTSPGTSTLSLADTMMLTSTGEVIAFVRKDGTVTVSIYMIKVPYDYPTIQGVINAANPGDIIYVYHEKILINKTVKILAENLNTIIDAENRDCTINITAPQCYLYRIYCKE
jgi:hypothetical protein